MYQDLDEEFRERVLNPDSWVSSATGLIDAATLLQPAVDEAWRSSHERKPGRWKPLNDEARAVFFMLYAFAIENLLKARIVERESEAIQTALAETGGLPRLLRGHDLYDLACRAGMEAVAIEHELLIHRLSRSAVWYGRYPVPTKPADLKSGRESPNLAPYLAGLWAYSADDIPRLKSIVSAIS